MLEKTESLPLVPLTPAAPPAPPAPTVNVTPPETAKLAQGL